MSETPKTFRIGDRVRWLRGRWYGAVYAVTPDGYCGVDFGPFGGREPVPFADLEIAPESAERASAPTTDLAEAAALRALREVIDADRHPPFRDPAARVAAASAILAHVRAGSGKGDGA